MLCILCLCNHGANYEEEGWGTEFPGLVLTYRVIFNAVPSAQSLLIFPLETDLDDVPDIRPVIRFGYHTKCVSHQPNGWTQAAAFFDAMSVVGPNLFRMQNIDLCHRALFYKCVSSNTQLRTQLGLFCSHYCSLHISSFLLIGMVIYPSTES